MEVASAEMLRLRPPEKGFEHTGPVLTADEATSNAPGHPSVASTLMTPQSVFVLSPDVQSVHTGKVASLFEPSSARSGGGTAPPSAFPQRSGEGRSSGFGHDDTPTACGAAGGGRTSATAASDAVPGNYVAEPRLSPLHAEAATLAQGVGNDVCVPRDTRAGEAGPSSDASTLPEQQQQPARRPRMATLPSVSPIAANGSRTPSLAARLSVRLPGAAATRASTRSLAVLPFGSNPSGAATPLAGAGRGRPPTSSGPASSRSQRHSNAASPASVAPSPTPSMMTPGAAAAAAGRRPLHPLLRSGSIGDARDVPHARAHRAGMHRSASLSVASSAEAGATGLGGRPRGGWHLPASPSEQRPRLAAGLLTSRVGEPRVSDATEASMIAGVLLRPLSPAAAAAATTSGAPLHRLHRRAGRAVSLSALARHICVTRDLGLPDISPLPTHNAGATRGGSSRGSATSRSPSVSFGANPLAWIRRRLSSAVGSNAVVASAAAAIAQLPYTARRDNASGVVGDATGLAGGADPAVHRDSAVAWEAAALGADAPPSASRRASAVAEVERVVRRLSVTLAAAAAASGPPRSLPPSPAAARARVPIDPSSARARGESLSARARGDSLSARGLLPQPLAEARALLLSPLVHSRPPPMGSPPLSSARFQGVPPSSARMDSVRRTEDSARSGGGGGAVVFGAPHDLDAAPLPLLPDALLSGRSIDDGAAPFLLPHQVPPSDTPPSGRGTAPPLGALSSRQGSQRSLLLQQHPPLPPNSARRAVPIEAPEASDAMLQAPPTSRGGSRTWVSLPVSGDAEGTAPGHSEASGAAGPSPRRPPSLSSLSPQWRTRPPTGNARPATLSNVRPESADDGGGGGSGSIGALAAAPSSLAAAEGPSVAPLGAQSASSRAATLAALSRQPGGISDLVSHIQQLSASSAPGASSPSGPQSAAHPSAWSGHDRSGTGSGIITADGGGAKAADTPPQSSDAAALPAHRAGSASPLVRDASLKRDSSLARDTSLGGHSQRHHTPSPLAHASTHPSSRGRSGSSRGSSADQQPGGAVSGSPRGMTDAPAIAEVPGDTGSARAAHDVSAAAAVAPTLPGSPSMALRRGGAAAAAAAQAEGGARLISPGRAGSAVCTQLALTPPLGASDVPTSPSVLGGSKSGPVMLGALSGGGGGWGRSLRNLPPRMPVVPEEPGAGDAPAALAPAPDGQPRLRLSVVGAGLGGQGVLDSTGRAPSPTFRVIAGQAADAPLRMLTHRGAGLVATASQGSAAAAGDAPAASDASAAASAVSSAATATATERPPPLVIADAAAAATAAPAVRGPSASPVAAAPPARSPAAVPGFSLGIVVPRPGLGSPVAGAHSVRSAVGGLGAVAVPAFSPSAGGGGGGFGSALGSRSPSGAYGGAFRATASVAGALQRGRNSSTPSTTPSSNGPTRGASTAAAAMVPSASASATGGGGTAAAAASAAAGFISSDAAPSGSAVPPSPSPQLGRPGAGAAPAVPAVDLSILSPTVVAPAVPSPTHARQPVTPFASAGADAFSARIPLLATAAAAPPLAVGDAAASLPQGVESPLTSAASSRASEGGGGPTGARRGPGAPQSDSFDLGGGSPPHRHPPPYTSSGELRGGPRAAALALPRSAFSAASPASTLLSDATHRSESAAPGAQGGASVSPSGRAMQSSGGGAAGFAGGAASSEADARASALSTAPAPRVDPLQSSPTAAGGGSGLQRSPETPQTTPSPDKTRQQAAATQTSRVPVHAGGAGNTPHAGRLTLRRRTLSERDVAHAPAGTTPLAQRQPAAFPARHSIVVPRMDPRLLLPGGAGGGDVAGAVEPGGPPPGTWVDAGEALGGGGAWAPLLPAASLRLSVSGTSATSAAAAAADLAFLASSLPLPGAARKWTLPSAAAPYSADADAGGVGSLESPLAATFPLDTHTGGRLPGRSAVAQATA